MSSGDIFDLVMDIVDICRVFHQNVISGDVVNLKSDRKPMGILCIFKVFLQYVSSDEFSDSKNNF